VLEVHPATAQGWSADLYWVEFLFLNSRTENQSSESNSTNTTRTFAQTPLPAGDFSRTTFPDWLRAELGKPHGADVFVDKISFPKKLSAPACDHRTWPIDCMV